MRLATINRISFARCRYLLIGSLRPVASPTLPARILNHSLCRLHRRSPRPAMIASLGFRCYPQRKQTTIPPLQQNILNCKNITICAQMKHLSA